jgi:acetyltransferase-like isoleucine patch superfamily enzyme
VITDIERPIKDQGLVKTPVRIGPGGWLGVKSSVLRGTLIGAGGVLGAHSVARGSYPDNSVIVGVPGRVVANRETRYAESASTREALADMARKNAEAARRP